MKENRRDFMKKGATFAAAMSVGSASSALAEKREADAKAVRAFQRDAGIRFGLMMGPTSPRVPFARQIDALEAVIGVMPPPGLKPWEAKAVIATKEAIEKAGLKWSVVEGPPALGNQTKLGLANRDEEISNFITLMKNLRQNSNVDVICYNWMPVISWARTDFARKTRGDALVTAFDYNDIKDKPLTEFGEVSKETLWKNLEYFLKAVVPEAEKVGMRLSLHPDDPQVNSIQGISRIMNTVENFDKMLKLVPSKYSGVTMCQGNFSLMGADIPTLVRRWGSEKISFVHFRNVQDLSGVLPSTKFTETFHDEGQINMYEAMKAYYDIGFKGTMRPDHVPGMAGEGVKTSGYDTLGTLYAIGYMRGLAESVAREGSKSTKLSSTGKS